MELHNLEIIGNSKGLKIIHVNARSLFNKLDELKYNLKGFDIIVFTETWLNSSVDDSLLKWDNYQLVRLDREQVRNNRGGGVCVYIRSSIKFEIMQDFNEMLDNNIEFVYIVLKPPMQKPIHLFGIYRPPDGKSVDFTQHIVRMLNQIDRYRSETILIGDFNIDFNNKRLVSSANLDTLVNKYGLKQVIVGNTRITDTSSTCIDLIYTDMTNVIEAGAINYNISDHLPIYLVKKKIRNKIIKSNVIGRSYLHYDKGVLNRILGASEWTQFDAATDPETLWDCFCSNVTKALDIMCPIKSLTVVDNKPEWLLNDLLISMRLRDKAFSKARRTHCHRDWELARNLRNAFGMEIKTSKSNLIKGKLERHKDNPKKFWFEINKLLPHANDSTIRSIHDEITGNMFEGLVLNEHINEYFSNIGSKLANECAPGVVMNDSDDDVDNIALFNRTPFTAEEVLKVCKEINIHKSAAILNIKTLVLKDAFVDNIDRFSKIFNSLLTMSVFPKAWKLSTIVPLPKVPHPKTASDLRPVALTPLPGKLMERLICSRLQGWLSDNGVLSEAQHGFRKKKSTISAIVSLLDAIYKNINNNNNSYIIYLDLKKAFDTISHEKMIKKLEALGLDGLTLGWFNSYLLDRSQCVKLNNMIPDTLPITYGVPQGSILGPILFSIYINDIADIVNCGIVLYADDTVIFHHDKNTLQNNLRIISDWCNDNLLTINVKKSHWMRTKVCGKVDDDMNQENITFFVKDKKLTEVEVYKYLGLHIDSSLNFQPHHKKLISQAQLKLSQFRKIRSFVNKKAAILIYKCTILPVLEYADFI